MKKNYWLLLILALTLWYCQSAFVQDANPTAPVNISGGRCGSTDPASPITNLYDNNPQTIWNTSAKTGTETNLELKLAQAVFLDFLVLDGVQKSNQYLSIDYADQDGVWRPLIGCRNIGLRNGRIDLSLSGVKADALRLVIGSQALNQKLGYIGEIKVYGHLTEPLVRLKSQIRVSGSNELTTSRHLSDQNTYTIWQPQPETVTVH